MSSADRRLARLIDLFARSVDKAHVAEAAANRRAEAAAHAWDAAEEAYRSAVGEPSLHDTDPETLEADAARRVYLRALAERRHREADVAHVDAKTAHAHLVDARIEHAKLERFHELKLERAEEEERKLERRESDAYAARLARK